MLIKTLHLRVRLLLDASALVPEVLPEISGKNCILSPHTGEYKRLFGHAVPDDDASSNSRTAEYSSVFIRISKSCALALQVPFQLQLSQVGVCPRSFFAGVNF